MAADKTCRAARPTGVVRFLACTDKSCLVARSMACMICPVVQLRETCPELVVQSGVNTKYENTETHQLSVAHNHSVILNHFCCFLCFSKKNHSSYGGVRGWLVGQSAAVHCLECKCVYSVEIVSHHSVILNHFCCFLSFSKKNHSSYGGVRDWLVGQSATVHCFECKYVYSVEIVSKEHNSNLLFLCRNN